MDRRRMLGRVGAMAAVMGVGAAAAEQAKATKVVYACCGDACGCPTCCSDTCACCGDACDCPTGCV